MKIEVSRTGQFVLEEVYNGVQLKTREGNCFLVYMRDDTVEMKIIGSDHRYRANMQTGEINEMTGFDPTAKEAGDARNGQI